MNRDSWSSEGLLHTCRYLFNVGEGFQRFATQHQVNFKYLADILLTRISSDAAGGLPGEGDPSLPSVHARMAHHCSRTTAEADLPCHLYRCREQCACSPAVKLYIFLRQAQCANDVPCRPLLESL